MKSKNVLHLVEYLYLGGIERLLEQLSTNIKDKASLYFFTYETETLGGIGKQIQENGYPVFNYKKKEGRDWKLLSRLFDVIKDNDIEVIHTHDFGPMEYAVLLKLRFPSLKLIHTQHTIVHFVRSWKYTLFFQVASYFYTRIIAVSCHVRDILLEQCPLMNRFDLVIIYNGVDTRLYSPSQTSYSRATLNLVSISRISPEKNFNYLLNTCRLLKLDDIPFVFHHAGTSKVLQDLEVIKEYIKKNRLDDDIVLHGFIENAKVILDLGDIFISSSKTEGHPVALLEAMACEKLCFCSDIPAHREIDNESIYFFDLKDERSLLKLLTEYFKSIPDTTLRRKKSRQVVIDKFSIEKMVDAYVDLY
jgi:glycosyltransferase involved in cell wall biosynthesis